MNRGRDAIPMAESYNEPEQVVVDTSWQKGTAPDHPLRKKKMRFSPPEIDHSLQLKWGLALLGEERSREYLAWLREKIDQTAHQ